MMSWFFGSMLRLIAIGVGAAITFAVGFVKAIVVDAAISNLITG